MEVGQVKTRALMGGTIKSGHQREQEDNALEGQGKEVKAKVERK